MRRATEASRADLLATEEARQAVILSLVSAVANGYIVTRDLDKQLEVAIRTAKAREDSYNLFKLRYEGGVISELELNQVKSEYEQALATIPQIEKQILPGKRAEYAAREKPGCHCPGKEHGRTDAAGCSCGSALGSAGKAAGYPPGGADPHCRQCPDRCGKAQYFPTISLTGLFGWSSTDLSNLFTGPAQVWSWGGSRAPDLHGRRHQGQVKAAEAIQQQTLFNYQSTIQTAFREVDDALVDQKRTREQLEAQKGRWMPYGIRPHRPTAL